MFCSTPPAAESLMTTSATTRISQMMISLFIAGPLQKPDDSLLVQLHGLPVVPLFPVLLELLLLEDLHDLAPLHRLRQLLPFRLEGLLPVGNEDRLGNLPLAQVPDVPEGEPDLAGMEGPFLPAHQLGQHGRLLAADRPEPVLLELETPHLLGELLQGLILRKLPHVEHLFEPEPEHAFHPLAGKKSRKRVLFPFRSSALPLFLTS